MESMSKIYGFCGIFRSVCMPAGWKATTVSLVSIGNVGRCGRVRVKEYPCQGS